MKSEPAELESIVLDTNVIASALAFGGTPRTILELGRNRIVEIFVSPFILKELEGVLASRKVRWNERKIEESIEELKTFLQLIDPKITISAIRSEKKDNRILECGVEAKAQVIVTGNMRHIRPLNSFQGIEILTPREFLDKYFPDV